MRKNKIYRAFFSKEEFHYWINSIEHRERQMTLDAVSIALNAEFGFGASRQKQFRDAFIEVYSQIIDTVNADAKSDKDIEYSKAKIDEALEKICGDAFVPWDERYYGKENE